MPKTPQQIGREFEERIAKLYRGLRSRSSGASTWSLGDVRHTIKTLGEAWADDPVTEGAIEQDTYEYNYIGECKATARKSYSLKRETWEKVTDEAQQLGLRPEMFLCFKRDDGTTVDLVIRSVHDDLEMHV